MSQCWQPSETGSTHAEGGQLSVAHSVKFTDQLNGLFAEHHNGQTNKHTQTQKQKCDFLQSSTSGSIDRDNLVWFRGKKRNFLLWSCDDRRHRQPQSVKHRIDNCLLFLITFFDHFYKMKTVCIDLVISPEKKRVSFSVLLHFRPPRFPCDE